MNLFRHFETGEFAWADPHNLAVRCNWYNGPGDIIPGREVIQSFFQPENWRDDTNAREHVFDVLSSSFIRDGVLRCFQAPILFSAGGECTPRLLAAGAHTNLSVQKAIERGADANAVDADG